MQVKISVRHGHLGEATQQVIREKANKLPGLFERITLIEVTVDMARTADDRCHVEFVVQAEHKHDVAVARESHQDVIAAVDLALSKVQGQLRRYKEKIQDHRRTPPTGEVAARPASSDE